MRALEVFEQSLWDEGVSPLLETTTFYVFAKDGVAAAATILGLTDKLAVIVESIAEARVQLSLGIKPGSIIGIVHDDDTQAAYKAVSPDISIFIPPRGATIEQHVPRAIEWAKWHNADGVGLHQWTFEVVSTEGDLQQLLAALRGLLHPQVIDQLTPVVDATRKYLEAMG